MRAMTCVRSFTAQLFLLLALSLHPANAADALPPLGADQGETTVSGLSSGAYMAGQFHIVHSAKVSGAAILAGGPFGCAESWQARSFWFLPGMTAYNGVQALEGCMKNNYAACGIPSPKALIVRAKALARDKEIDPLTNLTNDHVYLFTGGKDTVVDDDIVKSAEEFYLLAGVPKENIRLEELQNAGHTFVTENAGNSCSVSKKPFIADCDYDQAGTILKFLYGNLKPKGEPPAADFKAFDQSEFLSGSGDGMAPEGRVFVPDSCAKESGCRIHVVFHGCQQSIEEIGEALVKTAGFAEWAATNRIILLFPQIKKSITDNPYGCWDWWGYSTTHFTSKSAPQIKAVWRMIERLSTPAKTN